MQHFALAHLVFQRQARMGQHVRQPFQPLVEGRHRQFKEEVGGALAGTGIDLPTLALHIGHQPVVRGKAVGAEKEQVFEKMCQPWPGQRHVMAAGGYP